MPGISLVEKISLRSKLDDVTGICYYKTPSTSNQRCILFIHGLGCSKKWFAYRNDQYSVGDSSWLVPDLLGYGYSRHAPSLAEAMTSLTMEAQGKAVFDLACRVAAGEYVYVIAHSMGGPIALYFIEQWLATPADKRAFRLTGCAYAEGNISQEDCFSSGRIAKMQFEAYKLAFDELLAKLYAKCNAESSVHKLMLIEAGEPNEDPSQLAQSGAVTVYASAVSLVAESNAARSIARCRAIINDGGIALVFVIGAANRGKLRSEADLRAAGLCAREIELPDTSSSSSSSSSVSVVGGEVVYVRECGHGMLFDNAEAFWSVIRFLHDAAFDKTIKSSAAAPALSK